MKHQSRSSSAEYRRFLDKIDVTPTCWLWIGANGVFGYGQFRHEGRKQQAHRVSYQLFIGPIPPGLLVLHKCDVPACVNPHHLFVGTDADNVHDMMKKGRMNVSGNLLLAQVRAGKYQLSKSHCPSGHEYAGDNLYVNPNSGERACRICKKASGDRRNGRTLVGSASEAFT